MLMNPPRAVAVEPLKVIVPWVPLICWTTALPVGTDPLPPVQPVKDVAVLPVHLTVLPFTLMFTLFVNPFVEPTVIVARGRVNAAPVVAVIAFAERHWPLCATVAARQVRVVGAQYATVISSLAIRPSTSSPRDT